MSRIITLIAAAHLGHFRNLDEIADRQGGDLRGHRARRHGADQSRRFALEAARQAGARGRRRAHRRLRRACAVELQARQMRAAGRTAPTIVAKIGGREIAARIGAPGRHIVAECARRARRRRTGRRRRRQGGARACRRCRRRAAAAGATSWRCRGGTLTPDRRKLQRQSGLDEGGARAARRGAGAAARAADRRARRHAGARRPCRRSCMPAWPS